MKIAILGAGRIGSMHARTLSTIHGVDEVIVANALPGRAASVARDLGVREARSIESAIDEADGVVVTTPSDSHPDVVRSALGRGKPTFCEKPLAADLDAAIRLRDDIDASGVAFQLGFQRRFDPAYVEARRLVSSGELGTLYMVNAQTHDPAPSDEAFIARSGGTFRDLSVHDIDIVRFLTASDVVEVYAQGAVRDFPVYAKYGDVDTAVATLRMDDGVLVTLAATRHDPLGHDVRTEVFGSLDSVSVGLGPRTPLRSVEPGTAAPQGPPWRSFVDRWEAAFRDEMQAFVQVVEGVRPSPCTAADGVEAQRVAEALVLAVDEHRIVRLAEIPS